VKAKLRSIANHLEALDERNLTERERNAIWRDITAEVTSLWSTRQVRQRSPEPEDEARNVQWYLENTLFDVVGDAYEEFEETISKEYDDVDCPSSSSSARGRAPTATATRSSRRRSPTRRWRASARSPSRSTATAASGSRPC